MCLCACVCARSPFGTEAASAIAGVGWMGKIERDSPPREAISTERNWMSSLFENPDRPAWLPPHSCLLPRSRSEGDETPKLGYRNRVVRPTGTIAFLVEREQETT
ncbi:unnamed protein product [Protopolystoma xenopodis]|uniref:Uncharacterized protein n=1 Tax=Protopolystoma xenopodis TaxID=117903 RepID=A0A3S5CUN9_9PLAT|nr:unnamed protein product [Protopolystoma xenopodis]